MTHPARSPSRIFVSYRREDAAGHVLALIQPLRDHFGPDRIFKDTDSIQPGQDFVKVINKQLDSCSVFLAMIGRGWLAVQDPRLPMRRIDNPQDFLRLEVATALKNKHVLVIPVLVDRATMPASDELPPDLVELSHRHAFELSNNRWESDVERLIRTIEETDCRRSGPAAKGRPHSLDGARRRAIAKQVRNAEKALQSGAFSVASDACAEILRLDPGHAIALDLSERLRTEMRRGSGEGPGRSEHLVNPGVAVIEKHAEAAAHASPLDQALPAAFDVPTSAADSRRRDAIAWLSLDNRIGVTALIATVFALNWIETAGETALKRSFGFGDRLSFEFAAAMSWIESGLSFERHDLSNALAVYGGSIAYFFVYPLLLALTAAVLSRRRDVAAYRLFALAVTTTYLLSLGCYLAFPVPERWAFPDSHAVLLSDLWSARLIRAIRPISGLDNCFPSFHVASTMDVVLIWYIVGLRFRHSIAFLGLAVVLSTFLLGIHWLADIGAGAALAVVSIQVAIRVNRRFTRSALVASGATGLAAADAPVA